jgi:hypothetical protein
MPILNDAGVADYPRDMIAELLARERITTTSPLTGEPLSARPGRVTGGR